MSDYSNEMIARRAPFRKQLEFINKADSIFQPPVNGFIFRGIIPAGITGFFR
jgi:hypothetical protein